MDEKKKTLLGPASYETMVEIPRTFVNTGRRARAQGALLSLTGQPAFPFAAVVAVAHTLPGVDVEVYLPSPVAKMEVRLAPRTTYEIQLLEHVEDLNTLPSLRSRPGLRWPCSRGQHDALVKLIAGERKAGEPKVVQLVTVCGSFEEQTAGEWILSWALREAGLMG